MKKEKERHEKVRRLGSALHSLNVRDFGFGFHFDFRLIRFFAWSSKRGLCVRGFFNVLRSSCFVLKSSIYRLDKIKPTFPLILFTFSYNSLISYMTSTKTFWPIIFDCIYRLCRVSCSSFINLSWTEKLICEFGSWTCFCRISQVSRFEIVKNNLKREIRFSAESLFSKFWIASVLCKV